MSAGGLGSALSEGASKLAAMGATALEHTAAVSKIFGRTDEGKMFLDHFQNVYQPTKAAASESMMKQALERAKADPSAPKIDLGQIHSNASKVARHATLGPKDAIGVTLAQSIEKKHGVLKAQSFSNGVSFLLKDYVDPMAESKTGGLESASKMKIQAPYSSFKKNAANAGVGLNSIAPSYTPRGPIEKAVMSTLYQTFSPLIVIPHLATVFNGLFGTDPGTFLKGVTKSLSTNLDSHIDHFQTLATTGAFAETHMRDIYEWNQFKATGHPEFTGSGAAHLVYKMFHQPGFGALRDYSLLSGANIGKMTAEQSALDYARKPSPQLEWQLKEFGLDPIKITAAKGQLDESDINRAVYKFVDKHYFLDNSLQRSMILQSSWAGRVLGTYHGYVTRQAKLMSRAMALDLSKQGAAATMKNFAIGMTLFPAMGEGIKVIQETLRGQDAGGDLKKDIQNIEGKHGFEAGLSTYAEAMGHIGAFGVYNHLLRGSLSHSLLQDAAGPLPSAVTNLVQDSVSAGHKLVTKPSARHHLRKTLAPVGRDLMYDTPGVSMLAQVLAHRISPNAKDKPRRDPMRELYHKIRGEDSFGNKVEEKESK